MDGDKNSAFTSLCLNQDDVTFGEETTDLERKVEEEATSE